MKIFLFIVIISIPFSLFSQETTARVPFELSGGVSLSLYQSVYSFQSGGAAEAAIMREIAGDWTWQAGARLGLDGLQPEAFARLLAVPKLNAWQPRVGFEIGYTSRPHFDKGDKLLREARRAMQGDISPFYVAAYAAPLSFRLWRDWRLNVLELQFGTHLGHSGRTLRAQLGIFSLAKTL
jgi:hypothetical protein